MINGETNSSRNSHHADVMSCEPKISTVSKILRSVEPNSEWRHLLKIENGYENYYKFQV